MIKTSTLLLLVPFLFYGLLSANQDIQEKTYCSILRYGDETKYECVSCKIKPWELENWNDMVNTAFAEDILEDYIEQCADASQSDLVDDLMYNGLEGNIEEFSRLFDELNDVNKEVIRYHIKTLVNMFGKLQDIIE